MINPRIDPIVSKKVQGNTKEFTDISIKLIDLMQGDSSVFDLLRDIDLAKVHYALNFILSSEKLTQNQKTYLINNAWRIYYKEKPPTPEEFLTEKYLGRMAESIYPRVRKWFLEFLDESKPYRNACLYTFIGSGKSTLSALISLYITTHLSLMRDPKKYFNLSPATILANVLCSYTLKKSSELLLEPIINILEASDFFVKIRTREEMAKLENEYEKTNEATKIFWTTASINNTSDLTFLNNIGYKLISSIHNTLGLTIVCAILTELTFFRDAGKSDDYIFKFYTSLKTRIESRMKGNYFGRSILDSSPNDLDSPIDRYILFEARKNPQNYVVSGSRWEWCPEDFKNLDDTFPVFKGGKGLPPSIIPSTEGYDPEDIVHVPKELYHLFAEDTIKALKDIGGIPSGSIDKLFNDSFKIENMFVKDMKNIYFCIKCDSRMNPQRLIWNSVVQNFFTKIGEKYYFYYKPHLPRVLHIDQSVSSDMSSIAICHVEKKPSVFQQEKEFSINNSIMYVIDLVVPIHPFGGRINLDAITEFVLDLVTLGNMNIVRGTFDMFQSEAGIQRLQRFGLHVEHLSVDKSMDPYLFLAQLIEHGNIKMGRNIFMKNNLLSLRILPRKVSKTLKIDHTLGEVSDISSNQSWEYSTLGRHAKDVSDSVAGAVYSAKTVLTADAKSLMEEWTEEAFYKDLNQEKTINLLDKMGFKIPIST